MIFIRRVRLKICWVMLCRRSCISDATLETTYCCGTFCCSTRITVSERYCDGTNQLVTNTAVQIKNVGTRIHQRLRTTISQTSFTPSSFSSMFVITTVLVGESRHIPSSRIRDYGLLR